MTLGDGGIGSWPARRARLAPHAVALRQGEVARTYAEVAMRVERLAARLAECGVTKGDRVAHLAATDIRGFELLFATTSIGAVFTPLNTRLAPPEISHLLTDAAPRVLVHDEAARPVLASTEVAAALPATTVHLDGPGLAGGVPFEAFLAAALSPAPSVAVDQADDAVILYTSGTTGLPKGAVLTHGNLLWNTLNQLTHVDVRSDDVVLCATPLFHATGIGQVTLPTLLKGGTVVVMGKFDAGAFLAAIAEQRITAFTAVPTMLQMLADHPSWAEADLTSLRYVIFGGSAVQPRVADAWLGRGVAVLQGYGMTEASPGVSMALPDGAREHPVSAGLPHLFVDVALLAADGSTTAPPGTGELLVAGPTVFSRYWNQPEATAAAFVDGTWYRTGDIVRIDDDGWLHVVDRAKDMIISGGENIYPAEVEAVLAAQPEVVEAAVVAVPDERWGEVGRAYVVLHPRAALTEGELLARLDGALARYKIPRSVEFRHDLPRTATGKVRKADLRPRPAEPPND